MGSQGSKGQPQPQSQPKSGAVQKPMGGPDMAEKQKAIKMQKTMLALEREIKSFQDKQKKADLQVEQYKAKAKELLQLQKKGQAKRLLQNATRIKNQSEQYAVRRKVIENKRFQLEQAQMDKLTVNTLGDAQQHLKDHQKYNEKLEEIIIDSAEQKMQQQEMNDKLKDLVQDDDLANDVDDLLAEMENDLKKEKQKQVAPKTVTTEVTHANTNVIKNKPKATEDDEISKMMADLA